MTDTLQAVYDVPMPAEVATLRLPKGVPLVDTLNAPADSGLPTENVQRGAGADGAGAGTRDGSGRQYPAGRPLLAREHQAGRGRDRIDP